MLLCIVFKNDSCYFCSSNLKVEVLIYSVYNPEEGKLSQSQVFQPKISRAMIKEKLNGAKKMSEAMKIDILHEQTLFLFVLFLRVGGVGGGGGGECDWVFWHTHKMTSSFNSSCGVGDVHKHVFIVPDVGSVKDKDHVVCYHQ